jgi:hypothetical protein
LSDAETNAVPDTLVAVSTPIQLRFLWRPQLKDPADEMVLETAVNGSASRQVTLNLRHFGQAASKFGIMTMTPASAGGDPQSFLGRRRGPQPIHQCCSRREGFQRSARTTISANAPAAPTSKQRRSRSWQAKDKPPLPGDKSGDSGLFRTLARASSTNCRLYLAPFQVLSKEPSFFLPPMCATFSRGDLIGNQPEPRRKSAKNKPLNIKSASFFHFRIILPQNLSPTMAAQYGENNLTNIDAYFIIVDR